MKSILHLNLIILASSAALFAADAPPAAKPNVVIVLVDDAGYGDSGCHGQLPAGRTQLHGWFQGAEGRDLCGAFYAKVTRRDKS